MTRKRTVDVRLASDGRGRCILEESAKKVGLNEEHFADILARLQVIEQSTWTENQDARRFQNFGEVGGKKLFELKLRLGGTDYRVIAANQKIAGKTRFVVGRMVHRESLNKRSTRDSIAKRALREIVQFSEREGR